MLPEFDPSVKYMRKTFASDKPVRDARLYVTALGLYDVHLNGKRVGDHIIAPEFTGLQQARALSGLRRHRPARERQERPRRADRAMAGTPATSATAASSPYGKSPPSSPSLEITFEDGSKETIISDASWKKPCRSDHPDGFHAW